MILNQYLRQCNSKDYYEQKKVKTKSHHESQSVTQTHSLNHDSTSKTIENASKLRLNVKQTNKLNYYAGARTKLNSQYQMAEHPPQTQVKSTERKPPPSPSQTNTPAKANDFDETKKQEESKFRSLSFQRKQALFRQKSNDDRCRSNEKIKVIDVFNQTPLSKRNTFSQQQLFDKEGFKERVVYQSNFKSNAIPQVPMSSRLNESRDILFRLKRKDTKIGSAAQSDRKSQSQLKSMFLNNPLLQRDPLNQGPYQFPAQRLQQQRIMRIDSEKIKNENILELLLLNTGELKEKFQKEALRKATEERHQMKSAIRVKASAKFPPDFFQ